ncbi:hypothetical protein RHMOL_Rhmol04G0383100 [Rhododendron molle]|uniref:Uncharacterized protein n=1 Tax=Rhododendron molle TaxID=49168 RepID=A0ACC0P8G3_RHOML|nr:hypothetical protein RHMOL_Rhmol04G0383100 [Rhododendron molle]
MNIWARFGIHDVLSNEKGFFFLLFEGEKFHQLLESGPWHFGGKLLILKLWRPHLKLEKDQLSTIPLWVHFYNIPLELWTGPGISYIASSVGRPLYVDQFAESGNQFAESGKRISFAKICVEVDCSSPLPTSSDLKDANGDVVEIRIHYSWKPMMCSDCMYLVMGLLLALRRPTVTDLVVDSSSDGSGVVNVSGPISVDGAGHGVGSPKRTVLDSGQHPSAKKSNRFDILQDAGNDLVGSDSARGVGEMDNLPDDLFDAPAEGLATVMAAIAADFSVVAPQVSSSPSISLSKGNVGKVGDNGPAKKEGVGGWLGFF